MRNLEKQEIKKNVLAHEPHMALFVEDDDALVFYEKISVFALKHLKKDGKIFLLISSLTPQERIKKFNPRIVERKKIFTADILILKFS